MSSTHHGYQRLDASQVVATVERLEQRIATRFPQRGLRRVAGELATVAEQIAGSSHTARRRLRRLRLATRVLSMVIVAVTLVALALTLRGTLEQGQGPDRAFEWLPLIESTINDIVFAAIAVYFLYALPSRVERSQLLGQLHRLRSLAHIVDMHQLTKDPERLRSDFDATSASVPNTLDRWAMEHYLDYCSELLSLIAKLAALCAEESQDAVVLSTVSTIETLTTGMSRKIWQKISLLPNPA